MLAFPVDFEGDLVGDVGDLGKSVVGAGKAFGVCSFADGLGSRGVFFGSPDVLVAAEPRSGLDDLLAAACGLFF